MSDSITITIIVTVCLSIVSMVWIRLYFDYKESEIIDEDKNLQELKEKLVDATFEYVDHSGGSTHEQQKALNDLELIKETIKLLS